MQITITTEKGTAMLPFTRAKWSGDYRQCARQLEFEILDSPTDTAVPKVNCPLGALVEMRENKEILFSGHIVSRTKNTGSQTVSITCHDRGRFLKGIKVMKKFTNEKAENIVANLAKEYGIQVGYLAPTGVAITRLFLSGNDTLYSIIATVYTLASQTTKKKYHVGFRGAKLYVTIKEPDDRTLIIQGKSNLIELSTTESITNIVSEVAIYNEKDKLVQTLKEESRIKLYGLCRREVVKQTKKDKKLAEAQKLLDDGGLEQKITVQCLGNIANVSGGTAVVNEPYTNTFGMFFIDTDVHEWKNGQYFNKLTLNFKAMMDEKEAGSLPNAKGDKTASNKKTSNVSKGKSSSGYYKPIASKLYGDRNE